MPTREEIREGMRKIVEFCGNEPDVCVGELEMYLDRMDVVIKVDRELPDNPYSEKHNFTKDGTTKSYYLYIDEFMAYKQAQEDMAGYVAVEPLVKE